MIGEPALMAAFVMRILFHDPVWCLWVVAVISLCNTHRPLLHSWPGTPVSRTVENEQ